VSSQQLWFELREEPSGEKIGTPLDVINPTVLFTEAARIVQEQGLNQPGAKRFGLYIFHGDDLVAHCDGQTLIRCMKAEDGLNKLIDVFSKSNAGVVEQLGPPREFDEPDEDPEHPYEGAMLTFQQLPSFSFVLPGSDRPSRMCFAHDVEEFFGCRLSPPIEWDIPRRKPTKKYRWRRLFRLWLFWDVHEW
jgi:hypothetical protein